MCYILCKYFELSNYDNDTEAPDTIQCFFKAAVGIVSVLSSQISLESFIIFL